jgi:hypothetical protein
VSFSPAVNYPLDTGPWTIAVGSFKGNGKLDLAIGYSTSSQNVSILFGNGDGTFEPAVDYPVGSTASLVAVGDFNGDGKLDLAVVSNPCFGCGGTLSILLGNGDGTFQAPVTYGVGSSPAGIIVGDFNGDGKLDLVIPFNTGNNVGVLLGNGDGTFQPAVYYGVCPYPNSLTAGDFNGDGKLDLAVMCSNQGGSTSILDVLLGNGDGTFQPPTSYAVGTVYGQGIVAADFRGNGILDLAEGNSPLNNIGVLLGNGDGTFQAPMYYAVGSGPLQLATADFNGDGKPDLAVTDGGGNSVSVLLGNGDGTFQPAVSFAVGPTPTGIAVGNFIGGGKPDLAVPNRYGNDVSILLNTSGLAIIGGVNFGSAGPNKWGVLAVGGSGAAGFGSQATQVSFNGPNAGVSGNASQANVGIASSGSANFSGTTTIVGALYESSTHGGNSFSQTTIAGQACTNSSCPGLEINNTMLTQAATDAATGLATTSGLACNMGSLCGSALTSGGVINPANPGGQNVLSLSSINLNHATVTLGGPAGTTWVLLDSGNLTLNSGTIALASGLTPFSDLIVVNGKVSTAGGLNNESVIQGVVLAPTGTAQLSPGMISGEVIAGGNQVSFSGGGAVNVPPQP